MPGDVSSGRQGWRVIPAILLIAGCGSGSAPPIPTTPSLQPIVTAGPTSAPPVAEPSRATDPPPVTAGTPAIDGKFPVTSDGRKMLVKCWGEGSTTVVLEGGGGEMRQFRGRELADRIAAETRVCLFDHLGVGGSDPAPNERRTADDLTDEIHALLDAAGVDQHLVLVGSSFGGMTMAYYAQRFPKLVSGVVTLDTPAPSNELNLQNFPEGVWDAPGNTEHLDVLFGFENRFAQKPLKIQSPLIVIRATQGQTVAADHYWLENNPQAVEVDLVGGHEIYADQPLAVAEQVLSLVRLGARQSADGLSSARGSP